MIEKKKPLSAAEKQIIEYLQEHPDFFSRHPEVLETLYLPHQSGAAVSLVEKQLKVLRERNTDFRTRLNHLMDRSKTNDRLFAKSRDLVLKVIDCGDAPTVINTLLSSFENDFKIEFSSLTLFESEPATAKVNLLSRELANDKLAAILDSKEAVCGVLRSQQLIALFGDDARKVGSAAALRLAVNGEAWGLLALGNSDSHYYYNGMDTLFLDFIADILNKVLYPKL